MSASGRRAGALATWLRAWLVTGVAAAPACSEVMASATQTRVERRIERVAPEGLEAMARADELRVASTAGPVVRRAASVVRLGSGELRVSSPTGELLVTPKGDARVELATDRVAQTEIATARHAPVTALVIVGATVAFFLAALATE